MDLNKSFKSLSKKNSGLKAEKFPVDQYYLLLCHHSVYFVGVRCGRIDEITPGANAIIKFKRKFVQCLFLSILSGW